VKHCIVDCEVYHVCAHPTDCPRGSQAVKNRPEGDLYV